MSQVIHGKVHGTTIELYHPLGIPDGQEVELTVQMVSAVAEARSSGDGIRRSAGPLPDDSARDDQLLGEIPRLRKSAQARPTAQ